MTRKLGKILLVVGIVLVVMAGLAYGLRNTIATKAFAVMVDRQPGLRCTHPAVGLSSSLDEITLRPLRCDKSSGPLSVVETESDTVLRLDGFKVQRVEVARATIDQRERSVSNAELDTLGEISNLTGAQDSSIKGLLDAAESYTGKDSPELRVARLAGKRAGKLEAVQYGFVHRHEGEWDVTQAERADAGGKESLVRVRNLDMRVTDKRGEMKSDIYLSKPDPGERPDTVLKVKGSRLNEKKPYFEIKFEKPPERSARTEKKH